MDDTTPVRRRLLAVRLACAVVLAMGLALFASGVAPHALLVAEVTIVALGLLRWGRTIALVGAVVTGFSTILSSGLLASTIGMPWVLALLLTVGLVSGIATAMVRDDVAKVLLGRASHAEDVPVIALVSGPTTWLLAALASVIGHHGAARSWTMNGDALNNVLFAREMLRDGGIAPLNAMNPVPLNQALFAFAMVPGRAELSAAERAARDLNSLAISWNGLIILTSLMAALLTWRLVKPYASKARWVATVAVLGSSMAIHTWAFTAMPLRFGFINVHVFAPLALSSMVLFVVRRKHPAVVAVLLIATAGLLSASWTPFVSLPLILLAFHCFEQRRNLLRWSRETKLALAIAGIWSTAIFGVTAVPGLVENAGALASGGGITPVPWWYALALAACLLSVAAFASRLSRVDRAVSGERIVLPAVTTAALAGSLALLLAASASKGAPLWSYYPTKFAWTTSLVVMPMLLGLAGIAAAQLAPRNRGRLRALAVMVVVGGACVALTMPSTVASRHLDVRGDVAASVLVFGPGTSRGDAVADYAISLTNDQYIGVMVDSGTGADAQATAWSLQFHIDGLAEHLVPRPPGEDIRWYAEHYSEVPITGWCDLSSLEGLPVVVFTSSAGVRQAIAELDCAGQVSAEPLSSLHR